MRQFIRGDVIQRRKLIAHLIGKLQLERKSRSRNTKEKENKHWMKSFCASWHVSANDKQRRVIGLLNKSKVDRSLGERGKRRNGMAEPDLFRR